MTFIYKTTDGSAKIFNKEKWSVYQVDDRTLQLDGFVMQGILSRRDVLDNTAVLGENASPHSEMTFNAEGKLVVATNATQTAAGSLSAGVNKAGSLCTVVDRVLSINKSGNAAIPANSDLVIGAGGRVVVTQAADVSLMSAVVSTAANDFANVLGVSGKKIALSTSADNVNARNTEVTLIGIDSNNELKIEKVMLSSIDSSHTKYSVNKYKALTAVKVNQNIPVVDLLIKNEDGVSIKVITTPVSTTTYGAVETDDSDDPLGHSVLITSTAAPIVDSFIVVKGTDENNADLYEVIQTNGVLTSFRTTKQFKTITALLVGADGIVTPTYDVKVTLNTAPQKIGTSPNVIVPANTLFEMTRV